eukprot:g18169.t1
MSGWDYFVLEEVRSSLLAPVRVLGGLIGLLSSVAGLAATFHVLRSGISTSAGSPERPFVPAEGSIEDVVLRPGALPLLAVPPQKTSCVFLYASPHVDGPLPKALFKAAKQGRDGWLYGAKVGKGDSLAAVTGNAKDIVKDAYKGFDASDSCSGVRRQVVPVVLQEGQVEKAYSYFAKSPVAKANESCSHKFKLEHRPAQDNWQARWPGRSLWEAAAAEETARWARDFVALLGLCPWAGPALAKPGAVQYHVVKARTADDMEKAVLEAVRNLVADSSRDPGLAITFVIAPDFLPNDFSQFYEWVLRLEDDVFGTYLWAEVWAEESDQDLEDRLPERAKLLEEILDLALSPLGGLELAEEVLGDKVIAAGFHPKWLWAGEPRDSVMHFDKRAPHPTVSLVHAAAIEGLEHISARVAADNAEILSRHSFQELTRLLQSLKLPLSHK